MVHFVQWEYGTGRGRQVNYKTYIYKVTVRHLTGDGLLRFPCMGCISPKHKSYKPFPRPPVRIHAIKTYRQSNGRYRRYFSISKFYGRRRWAEWTYYTSIHGPFLSRKSGRGRAWLRNRDWWHISRDVTHTNWFVGKDGNGRRADRNVNNRNPWKATNGPAERI